MDPLPKNLEHANCILSEEVTTPFKKCFPGYNTKLHS